MTDAEKCRMIAEFEGVQVDEVDYWTGGTSFYAKEMPDYPHDLNATMRAARRLPSPFVLVVKSDGRAAIRKGRDKKFIILEDGPDPARAAFLCLADYLAAKETR